MLVTGLSSDLSVDSCASIVSLSREHRVLQFLKIVHEFSHVWGKPCSTLESLWKSITSWRAGGLHTLAGGDRLPISCDGCRLVWWGGVAGEWGHRLSWYHCGGECLFGWRWRHVALRRALNWFSLFVRFVSVVVRLLRLIICACQKCLLVFVTPESCLNADNNLLAVLQNYMHKTSPSLIKG